MSLTLLALHGFTMNGAGLRHMLRELEPRLQDSVEWVYPDAPHLASAEAVRGLAELTSGIRPKPPNRMWWNASADGREYQGWPESLALLREYAEPITDLGVFGFSQGAAVAAVLAALSEVGAFPPLSCVVLVGGFSPRATELAALFSGPVRVPSLHVIGSRDPLARHGPALVECFAHETRNVLEWDGGHSVPKNGAAADAVADFIRAHAR